MYHLKLTTETEHLQGEFQKLWLPKGVGPLTQWSGSELMFYLDDAPWIRYQTRMGLLPVRLRSLEIEPAAMSWMIKDRELNRIVVVRLDGDDLRMVIKKPSLLTEAFDAALALQHGIEPRKVG